MESRKLKQMLVPMTDDKMEQMKTLVKDLARSKCKEQLAKFRSRLALIAQRPTHLKEFAGSVVRAGCFPIVTDWKPLM